MHQFLRKVALESRQLEHAYAQVDLGIGWAVDVSLSWGHPAPPDAHKVFAMVGVTIKNPGDFRAPLPLDLSLELVGEFYGDRALTHEEALAFVEADSLRHLWPFIQDAMLTLTNRAGGPAFNLPPLAGDTPAAQQPG